MILALALAPLLFPFEVKQPSEVVAGLPLRAPSCDWASEGKQAAVADVYLDGKLQQNIFVFGSAEPASYEIFLGFLNPGHHELRIERNAQYSAPECNVASTGTALALREFPKNDPSYPSIANAPILYARRNTVGKFSDIPLITYFDEIVEQGKKELQYTVIFSNEDGGTNTRALMARWGRTTDIEYIYRGPVGSDGAVTRAIIQGPEHKDIEFSGQREGTHPILIPVTDNNMVGVNETSALRFQIPPGRHDASRQSREAMMPPWTYAIMTAEMIREKKLRPPGVVEGDTISDPRNYLYVDYEVKNSDSAVSVQVRLRGQPQVFSSSLGRLDYAISRDGWVQTTVELPPGTNASSIAEVRFDCLVAPPPSGKALAHHGMCHVGDAFGFLLDQNFRSSRRLGFNIEKDIPTGQSVAVDLAP